MASFEGRRVDHSWLGLWTAWLTALSASVVVGGVLLALFPSWSPIEWIVTRPIDSVFFPVGTDMRLFEPYREWLYAVLGACLAGWGGIMGFVARVPFRAGQRWAWVGLSSTLLLWFLLDTALSLAHGVTYNAVLNATLFAGFALPLLATRRSFFPGRRRGAARSLEWGPDPETQRKPSNLP